TEWYPFAHGAPKVGREDKPGQSIKWQVKLLPDEPNRFPRDRNNRENHYYHARATDAAPLQVELPARKTGEDDEDDFYVDERGLRGGTVLQREKFLFYRG